MNNVMKKTTNFMRAVTIIDSAAYCIGAVIMVLGVPFTMMFCEDEIAFPWFIATCLAGVSAIPFLIQNILAILGFKNAKKNFAKANGLWFGSLIFSIVKTASLCIATLPLYLIYLPILKMVIGWILLSYLIIGIIIIIKIVMIVKLVKYEKALNG